MGIKSYKELDIWKKGMEIVEVIYESTKNFPSDDSLKNAQIRIAIPGNRKFNILLFIIFLSVLMSLIYIIEVIINIAQASYLNIHAKVRSIDDRK